MITQFNHSFPERADDILKLIVRFFPAGDLPCIVPVLPVRYVIIATGVFSYYPAVLPA